MKALSLMQPWPWAIFMLGKDIENRGKATGIRGRVLIHASKTFDYEGARWIEETFGMKVPKAHNLKKGGIVGTVEIVDCVTKSDSKWFSGPKGYVLKDAKECEFIPYRGMPGFFEVNQGEGS